MPSRPAIASNLSATQLSLYVLPPVSDPSISACAPSNVLNISDMGFDTSTRTELVSVELPAQRAAGVIVESVDELMDKLKNEAKVIS